jgi:choline transporter-like protein 2/4/5
MSDPTENPLRPSTVELTDKNGGEEEVEVKKVFKKKKYFAGFKPYEERGCTDCLCLVIFLIFLSGWLGLMIFSMIKGKPEVLYRATDYEGNVCGEYLNTNPAKSFEKGTAPSQDITTLKVGVMPRLVDDLMAEAFRATSEMSLAIPVITTQCAAKCPAQGDVFCSYDFLQRMDAMVGGGGIWKENPLTDSGVLSIIQRNMALTVDLDRFTLAMSGSEALLTAACLPASSNTVPQSSTFTPTPQAFCKDVFKSCDRIVIATTALLGRCVPTFAAQSETITERCVDPVTEDACNETSTFDYTCYNGKKTVYRPVQVASTDSYKLQDDDKKKCLRMETRDETVSEELPQASILTKVTKAAASFASYVSAVQKAWFETLLCGLLIPMVIGFIFLYIIKKFAGCIVWLSIILLELCFIAGAIVALTKAQVISLPGEVTSAWQSGTGGNSTFAPVDEADKTYYQIGGWILTGCAVVFLCLIIFLKGAIDDAIRVVKISATAVSSNFAVMLWPLFSFFWVGVFSALFCLIGVLLMASGDMVAVGLQNTAANWTAVSDTAGVNSTSTNSFPDITVMQTSDIVKYLGFFDLFMYFWACEFVQAISIFTIGGAVAEWYFAPKDQGKDEEGTVDSRSCCQKLRGNGGVCGAFCASIRSHPGTAAFGACIIAIVKTFKYYVAYIMNQINKANPDSKIVKCLTCMIMCCLKCFENCVKYLSKNAFLYSTVKGTNFCWSSYKSFIVLWNNFARFGAKGLSSALVMLFGKLSIMMLSVLCAYYLIEAQPSKYGDLASESYISSMGQFIVCLVVLFLSFIVAEVFFSVYDTATDSIMLCYCFDITDSGGECFEDKMGYKLPMKKTKEADDADDEEKEDKNKVFCCRCCSKKSNQDDDGDAADADEDKK